MYQQLLSQFGYDEQLSLIPNGVYMQDEEGETPPPVAESSLVHNGINCDGCGMGPLRGIRYKVLLCVCV